MNQFCLKVNHYALLLITAILVQVPFSSSQEDTTVLSLASETTSSTKPNQVQKPASDHVDFVFEPRPYTNNIHPQVIAPEPPIPSRASDKTFELQLKKKIFPFGSFSLDIKKYRENYDFPNYSGSNSNQVIPPLQPIHPGIVNQEHTIQQNGFFRNLFNHNFDWGALVKVPGITLNKFAKFGVNIFGGQPHNPYNIQSGLISSQMPANGLIDERISRSSKVYSRS